MRCLSLGLLLLGLAQIATGQTAKEQTWTQVPAKAPSIVRGETPKVEAPKIVANFNDGPTPSWIWGADNNVRYFLHKEFTGTYKSAVLKTTCDNVVKVKINGQEVVHSTNWQDPSEADITKHLKAGKNTIAADVSNQGGVAAFVFKLILTDDAGKTTYIVSDDSWTSTAGPKAKHEPVRTIAKYGAQPWGKIFDVAPSAGSVPANVFVTLPGFQVEKLFTVPKETLGSWVTLTTDNKGRLIVSDQDNKGLCRITVPPVGSSEPVKVEKLTVKISAAQGLLYAFDSLYVSVNGGPGSGFYRCRDTDGDDQFDEVVKLRAINGGGEHGPHSMRLSPDGKSIYFIAGNFTPLPNDATSRLNKNWQEDHLLPRQWDANGHARGLLAPGGWIAKTDPDGKTWEAISTGYRNPFDFAINADGELFAYDADMEWDFGTPWYRPTRVSHATSASEFGWRSGTGKWPAFYPDSLPAMVDIGPGSPVGVDFGYGAKFPAKYQKALYILDWTFGTIHAIHTEPDGSSYRATKEEFLSRTPLPLTDITIGRDGAMYFVVGGRGTQSELYRVTYAGTESTEKVDASNASSAQARKLRHDLEAFHGKTADPKKAVELALANIANPDRFIRYAARVALEWQPKDLWADAILKSTDPETVINGVIALARVGDKAIAPKLLETLGKQNFAGLSMEHKLGWVRAMSLVFLRTGEPTKEVAAALVAKYDGLFPSGDDFLDRELSQLLIYLKSPTIVAKASAILKQPWKPTPPKGIEELIARNKGYGGSLAAMIKNAPDLQKIALAFNMRNAKEGWTMEHRKAFYGAIADSRTRSGGASYQGFLTNIEKDAYDNTSDVDRLAIEAAGLRKPYKIPALPKPVGPGQEWDTAKVLALESKLSGRDFKNGQKMFAATRCVVCHRFYADGGATGPDLTQVAGRFSYKDLVEAITEPSKVISDQYKASAIFTNSGKNLTGKVIGETATTVSILTDPEDSTKVVDVKKSEIEEIKVSKTSLMPQDLLKPLNENEVLDLMAFLLSRGDPNHAVFKKK
jgi:putative heme-binding domain-containing protein